MKKFTPLLIVLIFFLNLLILIYLENKTNDMIQEQKIINSQLLECIEKQDKRIRMLETDNTILTRIIINGEYELVD